MKKHLIQLSNLRKAYQRIVALENVDLTIDEGITGLLGPNGAGKSTLIKVLMGLVHINQGEGEVLGYPLGRHGRRIRSLVGYMPEDDCYITGMTGIEMVRFSACLAGIPSIEALRRAHEILDFCGVHQERYRSVEGYSTGMRQKTKFAAAIVHDPLLLILDEPTSGLDPEERDALLNRVRVLCENFGKSALISTHILPDVQAICDHVVILSNGVVRVSERLSTLNRHESSMHILSVVGKTGLVADQLVQAGFEARAEPDDTVSIVIGSSEAMNRVWQVCEDRQVVVKSLVPVRNSIEQIFMDAIQGDVNAHS